MRVKYFFVGVPAESSYFALNDVYYKANGYAQFGNFWVSGNCCQKSYYGLFNKQLGFKLPTADMTYETAAEKMDISAMPSFPGEGYITMLDERTVVIKVSEYKEYTGNSKYSFE